MKNKKVKNKKKRIIICAIQYRSGGSLILHYLCQQLRSRGYDARIFYMPRGGYDANHKIKFWLRWVKDMLIMQLRIIFRTEANLLLKEDLLGCKIQWLPFIKRDTLVVYNENIYGNPLKAKYVVRWLLSYFPFRDDLNAYGKNDLIIAHRDIFNDSRINPKNRIIKLGYYNQAIYKQTNFGKRHGTCYIIRKGKNRSDIPPKFDGPIIDDFSEKKKVEILNRCEFCYLYDLQTAYAGIAIVCGCIPIVVPEKGKNRWDYLGQGEKGYGIAYSFDKSEIEYAINTRGNFLKIWEDTEKQNQNNIDLFLEYCKEQFDF